MAGLKSGLALQHARVCNFGHPVLTQMTWIARTLTSWWCSQRASENCARAILEVKLSGWMIFCKIGTQVWRLPKSLYKDRLAGQANTTTESALLTARIPSNDNDPQNTRERFRRQSLLTGAVRNCSLSMKVRAASCVTFVTSLEEIRSFPCKCNRSLRDPLIRIF